MIVLDIAMIISLLKPGDERRQMIVWKASTWTLAGITGSLVFSIAERIIKSHEMQVNPSPHSPQPLSILSAFCFIKRNTAIDMKN